MENRRGVGRETWHRLLEWDQGQAASERLAARLLLAEGYRDIDPAHPLGGRDGGKDIRCTKDGELVIAAVYFPRGQQPITGIAKKFKSDLAEAKKQRAAEFVFFTNQELTLKERADLEDFSTPILGTIFHLERISSCLDTPKAYGLRLEFLSIEMTKEEQISFFNDNQLVISEVRDLLKDLLKPRTKTEGIKTVSIDIENDLYTIGYGGIYPSKIMECRSCEEIFRVENPAWTAMFTAGIFSDSLKTITCPACGKVQKYK